MKHWVYIIDDLLRCYQYFTVHLNDIKKYLDSLGKQFVGGVCVSSVGNNANAAGSSQREIWGIDNSRCIRELDFSAELNTKNGGHFFTCW